VRIDVLTLFRSWWRGGALRRARIATANGALELRARQIRDYSNDRNRGSMNDPTAAAPAW